MIFVFNWVIFRFHVNVPGCKRLLPMVSRKKKSDTIQLGVFLFFSGWKQFIPGSGGIVVSLRFLVAPKVVAEIDESFGSAQILSAGLEF